MDDDAAKIMRIIFIVLAVSYGIKMYLTRHSDIYKGQGYTIEFPHGWSNYEDINPQKKKKRRFSTEDRNAPKTVTFVTEEVDYETGAFAASMSITTMKLASAAWIEDEWGTILQSIFEYGNKIIDKGEIKIDEELSKWVFYESPGQQAVTIEFYIITELNMFYKISYTALPKTFDKYRKAFEESKNTILIEKGLF